MLRKRFWIPIYVSVFVIVLAGALFYGQHVSHQEPVKVYKPVEVSKQPVAPKPPPPGETYETGHWHGDVWHAEPHAQNNTSENSAERQTPRNVRQETGAQNTNPVPDRLHVSNPSSDETASSQPKKTSKEAFDAWVEWENKYIELSEKLSQIGKEGVAVAPATADEWERYYSDKEYKKEVDRKRKEASDKFFEVMILIQTHEEKRVFPPGMPTSTK